MERNRRTPDAEVAMTQILLVLIGLFAGIAGGLLGVGGSIVMIPAMNEWLGPDQHLYQATAMIVNFFIVVPAVVYHHRVHAIEYDVVRRLVPVSLVAVVVGVLVSELPVFSGAGEAYLRLLFGLFLAALCVTDIQRLVARRRTARDELSFDKDATPAAARRPLTWSAALAIALPTGFIAGALGVGGGILAVPLQRRVLGTPIRQAIANSATIIIATSLIGSMVKNYAYVTEHQGSGDSFILAAVLIPSAIVGSVIGSRLVHRLPVRAIRFLFIVALLVLAIRQTYQSSRSIRELLPDGASPSAVLADDDA
jgi:uncharacterized membrane protein YfcA